MMKAVGLAGKPTATVVDEGTLLYASLEEIASALGKYPHRKLNPQSSEAKQSTRMKKIMCVECGCIVRMTRKWLAEAGCPTCGCGGEMVTPIEEDDENEE